MLSRIRMTYVSTLFLLLSFKPTSCQSLSLFTHAIQPGSGSWRRLAYPGMWGPCISPGRSRSAARSTLHPSVPDLPTLHQVRVFSSLPSWTDSCNSRRCSGRASLLRTWRCGSVPRLPSERRDPRKHRLAQEHGRLRTPHTLYGPHPGIERKPYPHSTRASTCQDRELGAGSRDCWGPCQGSLSGSPDPDKGPPGACAARVGSLQWQGGWWTPSLWSAGQNVPPDRRRSPSGVPALSFLLDHAAMSQPRHDPAPCLHWVRTLPWGPFVQQQSELTLRRKVSSPGSLGWLFGWPTSSWPRLSGWRWP